jgi:intracellular sulfur oxidation DsrE/DsrF family protein
MRRSVRALAGRPAYLLVEPHMTICRAILLASACALVAGGPTSSALAQTAAAPYGSAKFAAYPDVADLKQLRAVWDFNFVDPKAVGFVFNYVNAFIRAVSEHGPHEIDAHKVVIVSHGPEVVVFARKNYEKYKEIVDRAASLTKQGVRIEICGLAARFQGFAPEDLHGFVNVVPAAPYALAYWQAKGYTLNAVGATMPTTPISDFNKADINK